jgi:hypothetical protein
LNVLEELKWKKKKGKNLEFKEDEKEGSDAVESKLVDEVNS